MAPKHKLYFLVCHRCKEVFASGSLKKTYCLPCLQEINRENEAEYTAYFNLYQEEVEDDQETNTPKDTGLVL